MRIAIAERIAGMEVRLGSPRELKTGSEACPWMLIRAGAGPVSLSYGG